MSSTSPFGETNIITEFAAPVRKERNDECGMMNDELKRDSSFLVHRFLRCWYSI
jgi:hypothetical protein